MSRKKPRYFTAGGKLYSLNENQLHKVVAQVAMSSAEDVDPTEFATEIGDLWIIDANAQNILTAFTQELG